jgi:hypothetical protein
MSSDGDTSRSSATSSSLHTAISDEWSLSTNINRPLNIANLTKNKNSKSTNASLFQPQSRRSFENEIPRPFSPSANANSIKSSTRSRRIANASPFFPTAAHYQSMAGFRAPLVPSPTKRHSAASIEDLNVNKPHIPVSEELSGPESEAQSISASGRHSLSRSGSHATGEQPKHLQDVGEDISANNGADTETFDYDGASNDFAQSYNSAYNRPGSPNTESYTRAPLRRVQKRSKQLEESDTNLEYNIAKRYKLDDDQEVCRVAIHTLRAHLLFSAAKSFCASPRGTRCVPVFAPAFTFPCSLGVCIIYQTQRGSDPRNAQGPCPLRSFWSRPGRLRRRAH